MNICVLGNTQAGKTTVGDAIALGLAVGYWTNSSSIGDVLIEEWAEINGVDDSSAREVKDAIRPLLWLIGRALERHDPLLLIHMCLERSNVVVGIRTMDELQACVKEGVFDKYVWVSRKGFGQQAEDGIDVHQLLETVPYVCWLDNDDGIDDLKGKATKLAESWQDTQ